MRVRSWTVRSRRSRLTEYVDGSYHLEFAKVKQAIYGAETELALAEDQRRLADERNKDPKESASASARQRLPRECARFLWRWPRPRHKLLVEYSKGKKMKELKSAIQKARLQRAGTESDLGTPRVKSEGNRGPDRTLQDPAAPHDGTIRYRRGLELEEGTMVREGQRLFEIIP